MEQEFQKWVDSVSRDIREAIADAKLNYNYAFNTFEFAVKAEIGFPTSLFNTAPDDWFEDGVSVNLLGTNLTFWFNENGTIETPPFSINNGNIEIYTFYFDNNGILYVDGAVKGFEYDIHVSDLVRI